MVTSFSPRRHHGETATLFSPHPASPSPSRSLLHNPPSSCSPFALSLPTSIKTRSASRRSTPTPTPTKPRVDSKIPAKFPLSIASSNSMNTGGMTLQSGSSSPHSGPREQTAQRVARTTLCPDSGLSRPLSTSPLKRGDGMMNMDEASRGSPVAKRRNSHFGFYSSLHSQKPPVFGSPSLGAGSRSPPKRNHSTKKTSGHIFEKPSFVRSRPMGRHQLDFSSSSDTTSRVRRVTSVENFFTPGLSRESPFTARTAPLPSASAHPHPLSQSALNAPQEVNQLSSGEASDWRTPQNYKSAKPNILAFHSTGFVPKRGRTLDEDKDHTQQPDTPCKRTTAIFPGSAFQINNFGAKIPMGDLGSPHTPVPTSNQGTTLLDSFMSNDGYDQPDSTQSSGDYELPPTPTKKSWNDFDDDSVFTMNKRLRTESSSGGPKARLNTRLRSPRTPQDNIVPPDPSSLSISGKVYNYNHMADSKRASLPSNPVTPARDFSHFNFGRGSSPPFYDSYVTEDGMSLFSKFSEVKHIGTGEFSEVYRVTEKLGRSYGQLFTPGKSSESGFSSSPIEQGSMMSNVYAVKRAKNKFLGPRDRRERMQEVQILKELGKHDHIVNYVDHWMDDGNYLCIQTEFCENGSLDKFLELHGTKGRLDEFRVWKMLLELCLGLQYIHESGYMHLDLKPGNVFITFDGSLKIGDFGMAMRCPPEYDLEKEGDRAYIAQEVLDRKPGQPGDIFSLGVCIIEIAGNEALPPYGNEWESLRKGDISVAPILSTSMSGEFVHRDEDGNPIATELLVENSPGPVPRTSLDISPSVLQRAATPSPRLITTRPRRGSLLHKPKPGHLVEPPSFMEKNGLEKIVKRMIAQDPEARPTARDLLRTDELHWINNRRRSTATIFEGLWGPCNFTVDSVSLETGPGHNQVSRTQRLSGGDFEMEM